MLDRIRYAPVVLVIGICGLLARVWFVRHYATVADDGALYLELARNLLQHHTYTRALHGVAIASSARMPGYPIFLALVLGLFGPANLTAVYAAQIAVDFGTALLVGELAFLICRGNRQRAAVVGFALAWLCPFLAMYTAAILSETLAVFCTTLAIVWAIQALQRGGGAAFTCDGSSRKAGSPAAVHGGAVADARTCSQRFPANSCSLRMWLGCAIAIAAGIQVRPDTGVLLGVVVAAVAVTGYRRHQPVRRTAEILALLLAMALAPVVVWTIRNERVLHLFRPLVTPEATEISQPSYAGFARWTKTWLADFRGVEDVTFNVPGDSVDPALLPSRAFDCAEQRQKTLALLQQYNQTRELTPDLDAGFAGLARERIRAHPLRYYVTLPLRRAVSLWFSPRIEFLPIDDHWWPVGLYWESDPRDFSITTGYLLINIIYIALAVAAVIGGRTRYLALLLGFIVARTALLAFYESCEPRYTLEMYPIVIAWAAIALSEIRGFRARYSSPP